MEQKLQHFIQILIDLNSKYEIIKANIIFSFLHDVMRCPRTLRQRGRSFRVRQRIALKNWLLVFSDLQRQWD